MIFFSIMLELNENMSVFRKLEIMFFAVKICCQTNQDIL